MHKLSLRLPYLIYLSIASILIGVIIAPAFRDMPGQATEIGAMTQPMPHAILDVPALGAPQVALVVEKDPVDGWNITVMTMNFSFTPDMVNSENVTNTGHAHLYIDGMKTARLYGPYFHLPDLSAGKYDIAVTLSSNDHAYYHVGGDRIEARATLTQKETDDE